MGEGETMIRGFGRSRDTEATLAAVRALGVDVSDEDVDVVGVRGVGIRGLRVPREPIDCGNSGTLIRLLAGILAGQEGRFQLTGDESLRARPMQRIAEPLRAMGARVETNDGRPPLAIEGARLRGVAHRLPLASAQVKSCLLLAGLLAEGETAVYEPGRSRDHTERLLEQAGAPIRRRRSSRRDASSWVKSTCRVTSAPRPLSSSRRRSSRGRISPFTASASTPRERAFSTCSRGWARE
jgi:3-phosphoshikimate 1-carboxyvinyltransferase